MNFHLIMNKINALYFRIKFNIIQMVTINQTNKKQKYIKL